LITGVSRNHSKSLFRRFSVEIIILQPDDEAKLIRNSPNTFKGKQYFTRNKSDLQKYHFNSQEDNLFIPQKHFTGSAAPGRVEKCRPPYHHYHHQMVMKTTKGHLLFLLFTKSAAPPKSTAPRHCPPAPPPCRGPAYVLRKRMI